MKSLKEQVAELEISRPRDFDPEEIEPSARNSDDLPSDEERVDEYDGRAHYQEVEKSRLRKAPQPALGEEYSGATVSRDALGAVSDKDDPFAPVDDEDESDPFVARTESQSDLEDFEDGDAPLVGDAEIDEDDEIDSDEAFGESDEERFKGFKFSGSGSKSKGPDEDEEGLDREMKDEENGDNNTHSSDDEDSLSDGDFDPVIEDIDSETDDDSDRRPESEPATSPETEPVRPGMSTEREKLKALLSNDAAAVASSLSAAASNDAKKGKAVKQQYQTFDRLLDSRIKLQKGLIAANGLASSSISEEEASSAIRKAEEAALNLWSTIESLRLIMQSNSQPSKEGQGKKRKIPTPPTPEISLSDLWTRTNTLETTALPHRRAILNKWSAKTRTATTTAPRSQLLTSAQQASQNHITTVLDSYLATDSSKQAASKPTADNPPAPPTYDDTAFYQSLLRDLVSSRASNPTTTDAPASQLPPKLHPSGAAAHKRAAVDTKASKGRKVRYTVHEKLLDFAAVEDRSTWAEAARREFFASLFGGAGGGAGLEEDGDEEEDGGGEGAEGGALRLFRS